MSAQPLLKTETTLHITESKGFIKSVSVVQTGTAEAHWEHIHGSRKPALFWVFFGRRWETLPINVFIIEHKDGLILFDTGQDRAVITNPDYCPDKVTAFFMRHAMKFNIGPEDTLERQLEKAGHAMADVRRVVFSHLHTDHTGSIRKLLHAELVMSEEAWEDMMEPHPERHFVFRKDIDIPGAKFRKVTFERTDDPSIAPFTHSCDLMGDGSMILFPTPGHLAGSMSMLVKREGKAPLLLVGDLTYNLAMMERGELPGRGDKETLKASFAKVLELKERMPDLIVLCSHDPKAIEALR